METKNVESSRPTNKKSIKKSETFNNIHSKKKKQKAFTLIELLAVIIILGILLIIAIPSVTTYIMNSRREAYVDTAKQIIGAARNLVNGGKLEMYDPAVTYYIPVSCLKTENGLKTPYGEFEENGAYVAVTFDGHGYDYYWISNDTSGQGINEVTPMNDLNAEKIVSGIKFGDVRRTIEATGIDGRGNIVVFNSECTDKEGEYIAENSGEEITSNIVCKKATVLHTKTCTRSSDGCGATTGQGNVITYGSIVNGELKSGDAFDCDVNEDGTYDAETERFYYITKSGNVATLIFYSNVYNGNAVTGSQGLGYSLLEDIQEIDSSVTVSAVNNYGPVSIVKHLPSTSSWKHPSLIKEQTRTIKTEQNTTSTSAGQILNPFTYTGKSARFLTYQEVQTACGTNIQTSGDLDDCIYLLENTGFDNGGIQDAWWLETPRAARSNTAYYIVGIQRYVFPYFIINYYGIRPAIDVLTTNMYY